jgi:hypothetical protein
MSPLLDSETIRPLYDVHDGGAPRGFECKFAILGKENCHRVTRTLRGMYLHQNIMHGFKRQLRIDFEEIKSTTK